MTETNVNSFFKSLDPSLAQIALGLKKATLKTFPKSEVRLRWGKPAFIVEGKHLASICPYSSHVNLEFWQGAKLKSEYLEGTGKGLRHIKFRSKQDIKDKEAEIERLLKEAASL